MTEEELEKLANGSELNDLSKYPFWSSEIYSYGRNIRKYGYYPSFLPLCIQTDHGPTQVDKPVTGHLHSKAPAQFFHSQRLVDVAKTMISIPCYSLYSPFVFYRRSNNIQKSVHARGTLAFPAHSTHHIGVQGYEEYATELLKLPSEFQPVSVCMYFLDIQKGYHKIFLENKIPVFTAGDWLDPRFVERFYNILKNFQYTTSNLIGSYLFYSVEMDIPFFLYADRPEFKKISEVDVFIPENGAKKEATQYYKVFNLFSSSQQYVSKEQKELVEDELGIKSGLSRYKMAKVLYTSLVKYYWKNIILKKVKRKLSFLVARKGSVYVI